MGKGQGLQCSDTNSSGSNNKQGQQEAMSAACTCTGMAPALCQASFAAALPVPASKHKTTHIAHKTTRHVHFGTLTHDAHCSQDAGHPPQDDGHHRTASKQTSHT